jgi:hypothetical protein
MHGVCNMIKSYITTVSVIRTDKTTCDDLVTTLYIFLVVCGVVLIRNVVFALFILN